MLDSLARGLRAAGGVLSEDVYKQNAVEDMRRESLMENRRTAMAAQVVRGIESGAIDPTQGSAALKQLGYDVPVGPTPEARGKAMELQAMEELRRMAPSFRKEDGTFDRDGLLSFVAGRDPLKAAQYGKILGIEEQKPISVAPGTVLLDPRTRQPIYTNPATERPAPMSPIGRLIQERDALPEGHPNRAVYDRIIANEQSADRSKGVTVNNFPPNPMPLGKSAATDVDKSIIDAAGTLQGLTAIEQQFKPEYQQIGTRAGVAWSAIKEKAGGNLDPAEKQKLTEFSAYKRNAINAMNEYIKKITGAAMSDTEAKRILKGMPSAGEGLFDGDSPTEFKAKMDDAIKQTRMALARYEYMKRSGMKLTREDGEYTISLDRMPAIMNRRAGEIESEIRSISPGMRIEDIRKTTRQRLAAEFGLVQ